MKTIDLKFQISKGGKKKKEGYGIARRRVGGWVTQRHHFLPANRKGKFGGGTFFSIDQAKQLFDSLESKPDKSRVCWER